MSYLSNCRWASQETLRKLRREPGPFIFSTVLTALALAIPLFISIVVYGLSEPLRNFPLAIEIPVFTNGQVPTEKLAAEIADIPGISSAIVIPKDSAFAELNASLGITSKSKNARNPLPDIINAVTDVELDSAAVLQIAHTIENLKGVDVVSVETSWRDRLRIISHAANTGVCLIGITVLALVVLVIIGALRSTGRNAVEGMRALHLFGASPIFAVRPTAWQGCLMMLASSLGALILTAIGLIILRSALAEVAALYQTEISLEMPSIRDCIVFVVFSTIAGGVVASLTALNTWRQVH